MGSWSEGEMSSWSEGEMRGELELGGNEGIVGVRGK